MTCQECQEWIEQRGAAEPEDSALREHLLECASCREVLDREFAAVRALETLRSRTRTVSASPRVEARVMASFDTRRPSRRAWRWLAPVGVAAAALVALVLSGGNWMPAREDAARTGAVDSATASTAEVATEFFALRPVPVLEQGEASYVVRIRLQGRELQRLGFPCAQAAPSSVQADVLMGGDGVARAVRFVY